MSQSCLATAYQCLKRKKKKKISQLASCCKNELKKDLLKKNAGAVRNFQLPDWGEGRVSMWVKKERKYSPPLHPLLLKDLEITREINTPTATVLELWTAFTVQSKSQQRCGEGFLTIKVCSHTEDPNICQASLQTVPILVRCVYSYPVSLCPSTWCI